ncbi:MAG TPA: cell division protein FtsA, partial [Catalimonadaceae bacterium]|nr:cell division protein FtsA [Catalimonadaceae bacterium]
LNALKDLFEMRTGLECRLGYPTEHLGKSKLEAMKNPMFSTAIGLVMAGFKSVDERENQYNSAKNLRRINPNENDTLKPVKEVRSTSSLITDLFKKTRELLYDDIKGTDY